MIKTIFKTPNGTNIYQNFYGKNADVLAANYQSAHPDYILVSCVVER
jgi:hypothetical protein